MIVQTTAQIYSCNLASASSTFPSCIQAKKTLRMFSDLSHWVYFYLSLCTSGRRPRTIRTRISGISKQHLSRGSVKYNGSGLHTSQAIYSAYWSCFSIDWFYFESGRFVPTSVCLFVMSWFIGEITAVICTGDFNGGNIGHLSWYGNMALWTLKMSCKTWTWLEAYVYLQVQEPNLTQSKGELID